MFPISEESKIDSPAIQSTGDVKRYLSAEDTPWIHFTSLPSRWAGIVAELVQMVIDVTTERFRLTLSRNSTSFRIM